MTKRMNMSRSILLVLLFQSLFLAGCLNFKSKDDPTRFFTLSSIAPKQKCMEVEKTIGIARASIPDYLDRSKIVTEVQENELNIAEYNVWADSLDRAITRVVTENLSAQMPRSKILPAPWRSLGKVDYEVHINVLEFRPQNYKCETLLIARYSVIDIKTGLVVHSHEANITVPLSSVCDYYLNLTASMNQALCMLSKEIANWFECN